MASPSTIVWMVRHTAAEGSEGRCCGRWDVPLSDEGIRQAHRVAHMLQSEPFTQVYSSSLMRAVQTARIIAEPRHLAVEPVADLAEIHFGDLESLTYSEIERQFPEVFRSWMRSPTEIEFPNGESFARMRARIWRAMESLISRHTDETILIVSHAGVIRVLLGRALGMPDDMIFRLSQNYGAINRIDYLESGPIVQLVNGSPL